MLCSNRCLEPNIWVYNWSCFEKSWRYSNNIRIGEKKTMPSIKYHAGQREVQAEANSIKVADNLTTWVGPVSEYASLADMVILANQNLEGLLSFTVLSGPAPLLDASQRGEDIILRFPLSVLTRVGAGVPFGGLVINL